MSTNRKKQVTCIQNYKNRKYISGVFSSNKCEAEETCNTTFQGQKGKVKTLSQMQKVRTNINLKRTKTRISENQKRS